MLYQLSPSDLRRFYDDGYLIIEDLFSRDEVEEMAEAAERIRALGREIAADLPADDLAAGERKVEHGGSQFGFGGIDRSMGSTRLLRVVWAGGGEPSFLACGRGAGRASFMGHLLGSSTPFQLLNQLHAKYPNDGLEFEP